MQENVWKRFNNVCSLHVSQGFSPYEMTMELCTSQDESYKYIVKAISILHLVEILASKHNISSSKMTYFNTLVWTVVTAKCSSGEHCEMFSGFDGANDCLTNFHPSEMHRYFL